MHLILASSSPRRAALLRAIGISFKICSPHVREHDGKALGFLTPRRVVIQNAFLKARFAANRFHQEWVLGADTVVVLGRRIFGKPRHVQEAEDMLKALCGRTHRVITGVCLFRKGWERRVFAVTSKVTFKCLNDTQIQNYLKLIHPLDKAGAYAAQKHSDRIIRRVEGSFSNVVGLPMERLMRELRVISKYSRSKGICAGKV